jgi:hypothetical protein
MKQADGLMEQAIVFVRFTYEIELEYDGKIKKSEGARKSNL